MWNNYAIKILKLVELRENRISRNTAIETNHLSTHCAVKLATRPAEFAAQATNIGEEFKKARLLTVNSAFRPASLEYRRWKPVTLESMVDTIMRVRCFTGHVCIEYQNVEKPCTSRRYRNKGCATRLSLQTGVYFCFYTLSVADACTLYALM